MSADRPVHNHGPEEGIGVACSESLIGDCLRSPVPASPDEWAALANDIRLVDGNHDLGAGALAEALTARGWTRSPVPASLVGADRERLDAEVIEWLRDSLGMDEEWATIARSIVTVQHLRAALAVSEPPTKPKPDELALLRGAILDYAPGQKVDRLLDIIERLATGSEATPTNGE